jgi:hypothetical protein
LAIASICCRSRRYAGQRPPNACNARPIGGPIDALFLIGTSTIVEGTSVIALN